MPPKDKKKKEKKICKITGCEKPCKAYGWNKKKTKRVYRIMCGSHWRHKDNKKIK